MDKWEAKAAYVERRMRENRENGMENGLSEDQCDALETLCTLRHDLHTSLESIWLGDTQELDRIDDGCGTCQMSEELEEAGLPSLEITIDPEDIPMEEDYYQVLDDEDREEWEEKAEDSGLSGVELWREESGEFEKLARLMEGVNDEIEKYLAKIDKEYGTAYRQTGWSRLD